jgi:hypothetical protein
MRVEQIRDFVSLLQPAFYADESTIREALALGRAFNLIHYATTFKISISPLGDDGYIRALFARRQFERSKSFGPEPIECAAATAEDIVLRNLEWYRPQAESQNANGMTSVAFSLSEARDEA